MNIRQKVELLKKTDLFSPLKKTTLKQLCEACDELILEPEQILFEEGAMENSMYLILSGEILVQKGLKQIALISTGQYLGEMAILESKPRSATARAMTQAQLLIIPEGQFNKYLATEPKALISIIKTLSQRIRNDLDTMSKEFQKVNMFTHDIKNCLTPLGLVEMYIEDMIEKFSGGNGQKPRSGLEDLKKGYEVMAIVRKNLTTMLNHSLSQAKKARVIYMRKNYDVADLTRETVSQLVCHKYLKGKTVNVQVAEEVGIGCINYLDIKRVLQNLVINAGYVTSQDGFIDVAVEMTNGEFHFRVIDYGCGIPEDLQPLLLNEQITTKGEEGNGLGLLSCKEIVVNNHKGKFWFDTKVGEGTTFHFTLPDLPEPEDQEDF